MRTTRTNWLVALALLVLAELARGGDGSAGVRTPAEALAAFRVEAGFRVELVAAEPLVEHPVAIDVDADGRLWVVEMPGYMSDLAGSAEGAPSGRVVVLEDRDGDGRADARTVFLDGLVMPRSVKVLSSGVLVGEPPRLWLAHDDDGDGRADRKRALCEDFTLWDAHPALGPNSPQWTIDNRIAHAAWSVRLRPAASGWEREPDLERGQWGLTQDDEGRLIYGVHDDPVRTELVPGHQYARNATSPAHAGVDVGVAQDRAVWPAHPTPGVNDAGKPGVLRPDGTLAAFTSACGQHVYRGVAFPPAYRGNLFVCEPAGNLVHRYTLAPGGAAGVRALAPPSPGSFLASTDERFRPVSLAEDADGALLVVDMHRGVIQHRRELSAPARAHAERAGLAAARGQGRIWRVVSDGSRRGARPRLSTEPTLALAERLADPSGWVRSTAQRVLVERRDRAAVPALERMLRTHVRPLARLHALHALDGLGVAAPHALLAALADADVRIRRAALHLARAPVSAGDADLTAAVLARLRDRDTASAIQAVLSLATSRAPQVEAALTDLLVERPGSNLIVDAVVSGLSGREVEAAMRLCADPRFAVERPGARRLVALLVQCAVRTAAPARVLAALDLAGEKLTRWQVEAVVEGAYRETPSPPLAIARLPAAFARLAGDPDPGMQERVRRIRTGLIEPGAGAPSAHAGLATGRAVYLHRCAACHGKTGRGTLGRAPPIVGSPWISRAPEVLARIVLNGKRGPAPRADGSAPTGMPGHAPLPDEDLAALIAFLRGAWGPGGLPVELERVRAVSRVCAGRREPWTHAELEAVETALRPGAPGRPR